jgi:Ca2+-binding RTX toxin-like protein
MSFLTEEPPDTGRCLTAGRNSVMALIRGTNWDDDLYGDVFGFAEDDDIYGYAGSDFIVAGFGNDDLYGGSGHDWLYGGQGNDWLFGGYDDDVLYGEAGHDDLYGEAGHDDLYGGAGADDLYGGGGDDWLSGGTGSDYLSGGAGSDVFFFSAGSSGISGPTADVITDWDGGFDWVDTAIVGTATNYREAATTATSIESAAFLAESTFTNPSISHVFLYNSARDTGYLLSDLNNDDRFETGVVLNHAGYASDFSYFDLI